MDQYPILQSGFVNVSSLPMAKHEPIIDSTGKASLYPTPPDKSFSAYSYSPDITRLYFTFVGERSSLTNFGFREKVLEMAIEGFGPGNFGDWVGKQKQYGSIEQAHLDFLVDTACFTAGLERKLHPVTWLSMLNNSTHLGELEFDIVKNLEPEARKMVLSQNADIGEMLIRWTSRENGFADLVTSLMVIFGSRNPKDGTIVR